MSETSMAILKFREMNNSRLPRRYDWKYHLLINVILVFVPLVTTSLFLTSSWFFCTGLITGFFFIWSVIEYGIHRFILHGQSPYFARLNREHTVFHHGYFTNEDMKALLGIDVNRILLFPVDMVAVVVLNALISAFVYFFIGSEVGLLFFIAGNLYIVAYEIIHALCHLPINKSFTHHELHHDKLIMGRKNFGVVFPFLDVLFGTLEKKK
jgi:sterol desaturase/sphingolipid hydroxylase (fatty acid hydroxylase superfamily)